MINSPKDIKELVSRDEFILDSLSNIIRGISRLRRVDNQQLSDYFLKLLAQIISLTNINTHELIILNNNINDTICELKNLRKTNEQN